jgi:hypothetical protein
VRGVHLVRKVRGATGVRVRGWCETVRRDVVGRGGSVAKKTSGSPDDANPGGERSAAPFVPPTSSIRTLSAAAHECRGCDLYKSATQVVFGAGPKNARVMFVGEQPGDQETGKGRRLSALPVRCLTRRSRRGHSAPRRLCHQRRQTLQMGTAWQAAHSQEAAHVGNQSVPAMARGGIAGGEASQSSSCSAPPPLSPSWDRNSSCCRTAASCFRSRVRAGSSR